MRTKRLLVILTILLSLSAAYAAAPAPSVPRKVEISIEGFPLSLDVLKPRTARSTSTYRAEGVARIEGSNLIIALTPGFSLPEGGLVVDEKTRISAELTALLGLPSAARLERGIYNGTVYRPIPTLPDLSARGIGKPQVGIEIGIKINIGK